ncbi:hypothetical protein ACFLWE_00335 [Chloroflexota bacterium]
MSLTDDIYNELCEGKEKGLDWPQFLTKHSNSKGPLYNAIGRFFTDAGAKIKALNEERNRTQGESEQAGIRMDSLFQEIKDAEGNITSLKEKEGILTGQIDTLEAELTKKSELLKNLTQLERIGFDNEKLSYLEEALVEIGLRRNLKGKEAISKFFEDLKDYGLVLDVESRLKGLQTQIETKTLEVANWQAKEQALRKRYDDLKEDIEALKLAGVNDLKIVAEEAAKLLKELTSREVEEIQRVGRELRLEINDYIAGIETSAQKIFELGQQFERTQRGLRKYEDIGDVLEAHATVPEENDEIPEKS